MLPLKFVEKIYNHEITLDEAKDDQDKLEKLINRLENYKAKKPLKIEEKKNVLKSATELFHVREDIDFFEKGIFPFKGNVFKTKEESKEESKEELKEQKKEEFVSNAIAFIENKSKDINNDLFQKYFNFLTPIDLAKKLCKIKDAYKNSKFVEEIKNRWSNLKDEIQEMS